MKKILKSLKWYFSHLNWIAVGVIFGLVLVLDFWEKGHFNWILLGGLLIFLIFAPIYGIIRSKWQQEDAKQYKIQKETKRKQEKDRVIEYLSTMSYPDRLELLDEVQKRTKG